MKYSVDLLQELDDGDFHGLCDDLLRRVESRYRLLTPHGRNERGQSIRGQPDSYVGNTGGTGDKVVRCPPSSGLSPTEHPGCIKQSGCFVSGHAIDSP